MTFTWPRSVMKIFPGLMSRWTMPIECAASSASAISMPNSTDLKDLERRPRQPFVQRLALQPFHDDERLAVVFADIVDGADVRVVEGGRGARFDAEAFDRLAIARQFLGDELKSDRTSQAAVIGAKDHAHATRAELRDDAIVRNRLADHGEQRGIIDENAMITDCCQMWCRPASARMAAHSGRR